MFSNFVLFPIGHLTHPPTSKVFFLFYFYFFIYMAPKVGVAEMKLVKMVNYG